MNALQAIERFEQIKGEFDSVHSDMAALVLPHVNAYRRADCAGRWTSHPLEQWQIKNVYRHSHDANVTVTIRFTDGDSDDLALPASLFLLEDAEAIEAAVELLVEKERAITREEQRLRDMRELRRRALSLGMDVIPQAGPKETE